MPDQEIIAELIETYRELNHRVRGAGVPKEMPGGTDGESIADVLLEMRNRELNASQAIKRMLLGEDATRDDEGEPTLITAEQSGTAPTVQILLSQFGTAREATLAMIRELPDEEWDKVHETPRGKMSLRDYLRTLIERDRQATQRIEALLGKARV